MSDLVEFASRIRAHSAAIDEVLAAQPPIDHRFATPIDFHSVWPERPMGGSLTIAEEQSYASDFDTLDAELEAMCRLTSGSSSAGQTQNPSSGQAPANKPKRMIGGVNRQLSLKRQTAMLSCASRENLHSIDGGDAGGPGSSDDSRGDATAAGAPTANEPMVTEETILKFNRTKRGPQTSDVNALCDADKQTFRPLFKLVPKLREFTSQVQRVIAEAEPSKTTSSSGADKSDSTMFSELLQRLNQPPYAPFHTHQLIVDVKYLEEHQNIYDVTAVPPIGDDPVIGCLKDLCLQIMNS